MEGLSKQRALEHLRARIARIEKRPPLAGDVADTSGPGFVLPAGMLHEVFTDTLRHAAALLGFAAGVSRALVTETRQAVIYLQLRAEAQEAGLLYGAGFVSLGIDPSAWIIVRPQTIVELLWAAEEALACKAVAAVVADIGSEPKALDFTASRRLGMRAAETGTTFLLLRYGGARPASAARMRWQLNPAPSEAVEFDPRAPGEGRWRLMLEKGLWQGKPHGEWLLGWTKNGFEFVASPEREPAVRRAPVPRALPAALGDRLSQTA